jgi:DNA adenine methylase
MDALPSHWGKYYEPMVGGGALFFELQPKNAILSDINDDLINFYTILRDHPKELINELLDLVPSKATYYQIRQNDPSDIFARAVRFAYLNRLCWNGLYRVNKQGKFNVPFGGRLPEVLWDREHLQSASKALSHAELIASDYESVIAGAKAGDLAFFDPPYPRGSSNGNGFDRYSSFGFGIEEHKRLARNIEGLSSAGVSVILIISNDPDLLDLYPATNNQSKVSQKALISADPTSRGDVSEVVLKYFKE